MRAIYRTANYSIEVLNKERNCVMFEGELICKYDNDTNGIRDMVNDLIEFCVEDGLLTTSESKKLLRQEIKATIKYFNENEREEKKSA